MSFFAKLKIYCDLPPKFIIPFLFNNLNKIILKKPLKHWKNFDVILVKPLQFKKIKNIKLIKENIIEVFRKPSMLFKNNSLEDQFRVFHGSFYLDTAIDLLPKKYRKEFKTFKRIRISGKTGRNKQNLLSLDAGQPAWYWVWVLMLIVLATLAVAYI